MNSKQKHPQQRLTVVTLLKKIADEEGFSEYEVEEFDCGITTATSILFSATLIKQGRDDLKLIAKALLMSEQIHPRDSTWPYTTELYFYSTVIEKFMRMEKIHDIAEEHRLIVPKFYGSHDAYPNQTLILEDLTAHGFETIDPQKCVDLQHAFKAMELIAKFHALSLACYKEDPEGFQNILEQRLENTSAAEETVQMMAPIVLKNAYEVSTNENREALEKYFGNGNGTERDRFLHFAKTYYKSNRNMQFLVHGDFKTTNLIYRKRNNKLEVATLDFQLTSTRNPVCDLVCYFFTGADEQFRKLFYHQFLDLYYEQLKLAMGRLHVDPNVTYSEEAFRRDVEELSMAGLMLGVVWLPLVLADPAQASSAIEGGSRFSDLAVPPTALFRTRFNGIVNNYREWGLL